MRLTRLEVFGFKSFVDRMVLNFDKPLIGIIGPNGCGKSNVVDSLRWVLGETNAKQLRGTVLDDLIFNGSESRRPLGMAEVNMTIRPDEGWAHRAIDALVDLESVDRPDDDAELAAVPGIDDLEDSPPTVDGEETPIAASAEEAAPAAPAPAKAPDLQTLSSIPGLFQAAEIQLTRRLYRSGESEYFINRVPCRLRDMTDLYRLIGLGARGLSIVQQGQIGQFISKKPVERRELLEEAAGIAGFRAKIEAAQRKLDKTGENLSRMTDIIIEVEKQVQVLRRQANRARNRNELKANLREQEFELFRLKCIRSLLRQEQDHKLHADLVTTIAELRDVIQRESESHEVSSARVTEIESVIESLRSERDGVAVRLQEEKSKEQELQLALAQLEGRVKGVETGIRRFDERGETVRADVVHRRARTVELAEKQEAAEGKKIEADEALTHIQARHAELSNRSLQGTPIGEQIGHQSNLLDGSQGSEDQPETEQAREIARLSAEVEQLPAVTEEIRRHEQLIFDKRQEVRSLSDTEQKLQVQWARLESEMGSLRKQLQGLADHVVKHTGAGHTGAGHTGAGHTGAGHTGAGNGAMLEGGSVGEPLVAGLAVGDEWKRALSAVLGDRANYLVADDIRGLAKGFQERRRKGQIPSSGVKLGVLSRRPFGKSDVATAPRDDRFAAAAAVAPSLKRLLDVVDVRDGFGDAANGLLENVFVAATLEEAIAAQEVFASPAAVEGSALALTPATCTVVTTDGEIVMPWGWCTTSGQGVNFQFAKRIEELEEQMSGVTAERDQARQVREASQTELQNAEQTIRQARERREQLGSFQKRIQQLMQEEQRLERERRRRQMEEERRLRDQIMNEERQAQNLVRIAGQELTQLQSQLANEQQRISELDRELGELEPRKAELQAELAGLHDRQAELRGRFEREFAQSEDFAQLVAQLEAKKDECSKQIEALESERRSIRSQVQEVGRQVDRLRRDLERGQEEETKLRVGLERGTLEVEMEKEQIDRSYGEEAPSVPTDDERKDFLSMFEGDAEQVRGYALSYANTEVAKFQESATKLRNRLEREGEVDPQSIELCEQEEKRYDELTKGRKDLESAVKTLERTIGRLKEISKQRFLDTFKFVSHKFSELVPRLFGGGSGELILVNPEDPLQSGVELAVRPPGKRLRSLDLMSGGEKALTAAAVIVSMFLYRPSPICVLDEVDAPLDDANLERFLDLIRDISSSTQFLVITHNKQTMAAVDRLIGITMQESGISTAVTVSLEDAERELDNWAVNA